MYIVTPATRVILDLRLASLISLSLPFPRYIFRPRCFSRESLLNSLESPPAPKQLSRLRARSNNLTGSDPLWRASEMDIRSFLSLPPPCFYVSHLGIGSPAAVK